MTRLGVVVGNPKPDSRTLAVALAVADEIGASITIDDLIMIDLGEHGPALLDWSANGVDELVAGATACDLLIVASPTYKATYTGVLKVFLDRFGSNALHGTVAVGVMTAALPHHALAGEVHLRPLLVELGATVPTRGVFLAESDFDDTRTALSTWSDHSIPLLRQALAEPEPPQPIGSHMTTTTHLFDPFTSEFHDDPYTQYQAIRDTDPVHRTSFGPQLLTRWDDVNRLLRNPTVSVEAANTASRSQQSTGDTNYDERGSRSVLRLDAPDHTRLRRLMSRAFTPRAIAQLRPKIDAMVTDMLDDVATRNEPIDLISEIAFPLPFAVITHMLGMPDTDSELMRDLSHTVSQSVDPFLAAQHAHEIRTSSDQMRALVDDAIQWKRDRSDDDLFSALLESDNDGDALTDAEISDNIVLLYIAGHETTVNLIGNGIHALLKNRVQLEHLRDATVEDAAAVEELLRYDSPVQFTQRVLLEDVHIDDQVIAAGDTVLTGIGAANHDPAKFGPTADDLDLGRINAREHVSFGSGIHHCLGAALARIEGQAVIGPTLRRFPDLELAGPPTRNRRLILRGFDRLPVVTGASTR